MWLQLISGIAISIALSGGAAMAAGNSNQGSSNLELPELTQTAVDPAFAPLLRDLQQRFPEYSTDQVILVDATQQELVLIENGQAAGRWTISTSEVGLGSQSGSNRTPLGVHRVAKTYGDGAPLGAIFKARQNTGRVADILTEPGKRSSADNVTTRILWLDGLEPGFNKGDDIDSFKRYIYIHGTDEEGRLGTPASHGCIRMSNRAVVELFNRVDVDTLVVIAKRRANNE